MVCVRITFLSQSSQKRCWLLHNHVIWAFCDFFFDFFWLFSYLSKTCLYLHSHSHNGATFFCKSDWFLKVITSTMYCLFITCLLNSPKGLNKVLKWIVHVNNDNIKQTVYLQQVSVLILWPSSCSSSSAPCVKSPWSCHRLDGPGTRSRVSPLTWWGSLSKVRLPLLFVLCLRQGRQPSSLVWWRWKQKDGLC